MRPLTLDDLLPLHEFVDRRQECLESHSRYLDRYRRVRVGPSLTLVFENRQTLWFRVQEILRIARLTDPESVLEELEVYNRLLPGRDLLQAALLTATEARGPFWADLAGQALALRLGAHCIPANLLTCRPEDRCAGAAFWVQFHVDAASRPLLADFRQRACFEARHGPYQHDSGSLGSDVRQSLLDDLEMSDADPEPAVS